MPRVRVSPLGPKCYKSLLRFIAFLFVWNETRKIKCGADERRRRGLDRADPLSAPEGADANESRHSGRTRQFSAQKLAGLFFYGEILFFIYGDAISLRRSMFLINDLYGFISWRRMEKRQLQTA